MELNYMNYHVYNSSYLPGTESQSPSQLVSHSSTGPSQLALDPSLQNCGPESGALLNISADTPRQQGDVFLKVFGPKNKKEFTMYTVRNFSIEDIHTPENVKEAIFTQVGESVVSRKLDFQAGYYNKSSKLWLNDDHDVHAALTLLKRNKKLTLWCLGLRTCKSRHDDSEGEDELGQLHITKKRRFGSTSEEKAVRVNDLKTQLRESHGPKYSSVQYSLWAEMIVGGTHENMDEPPPVPMFNAQRPRGKPSSSNVTDALTTIADKLVSALSPSSTPSNGPPTGSTSSPRKSVELRGKYIQQLKDLVGLREIGALTDEEYEEQRLALVGLMRKL